MSKLQFYKYQGTGNDFVIVDNRKRTFDKLPVKQICNRRFGIGADGLMLLEETPGYDFKMVYYNSDGNVSSMCGNGGRCLGMFAHKLGLGENKTLDFTAIDGPHTVIILDNEMVSIKMNDVEKVKLLGNDFELNTGSPHYVKFIDDTDKLDILNEAHKVRYASKYKDKGINVNFVQETGNHSLKVRTYERGVEDETYSCGTGVTACAIALSEKNKFTDGNYQIQLDTPGGKLEVRFTKSAGKYLEIWLTGPAVEVYSGIFEID
jgi:diaminopimelate epimerase